MSKPWLQTWTRDGYGFVNEDGIRLLDSWVATNAELDLVVAAPEMCRLLLGLECTKVRTAGVYGSRCGHCFAKNGHHEDGCQLDAILTKAGLATQEQRDEARAQIRTLRV
jgi:hypothetical protein